VNKPSHGKGKGKPKPDGPPTCYGCGEKGHIRKHCPKEQKLQLLHRRMLEWPNYRLSILQCSRTTHHMEAPSYKSTMR
jgi:hypothetical protein